MVDVTPELLQALKAWKENPYNGSTDADFVEYIANTINLLMNDENLSESCPEAQEIFMKLSQDITREDMWCSLENSGDSKIIIEENGEQIAEAGSTM